VRGILFCPENAKKEARIMLNAKLEVVSVGTPDITKLTDSERRIFFETLYARVLELAKKKE
jgi:hypothetical protein